MIAKTLTLRLDEEQAEELETCMAAMDQKTAAKTIRWAVHEYPTLVKQVRNRDQKIAQLERELADLRATLSNARGAASAFLNAMPSDTVRRDNGGNTYA